MLLSNVWYCILNKIQWRKCLQVANREDGLRLRCSLQTKKVHCLLSRKVTFNPSRFLLVRTVKMCDQKNLPWPDQSLDLNIVSFLQIWREEYKADYLLQHPWSNWQMFWCSDIRLIKSMNLYQRLQVESCIQGKCWLNTLIKKYSQAFTWFCSAPRDARHCQAGVIVSHATCLT